MVVDDIKRGWNQVYAVEGPVDVEGTAYQAGPAASPDSGTGL
jgi:hypothetical protein